MSMPNLESYKKEIEDLNRQLTAVSLADESQWSTSVFHLGAGDWFLTPAERKEKDIERIQGMIQKSLACAGDLALFGETDNLAIG